jgi:hypothetical protein
MVKVGVLRAVSTVGVMKSGVLTTIKIAHVDTAGNHWTLRQ